MNRRPLSLLLACALSLSLLSACGGKGNDSASSGSGSGVLLPGGSASTSVPDASIPDQSAPEMPDQSVIPDGPSLGLNKSDFTLSKPGASYKLKAVVTGAENVKITWSSSNESVATVTQDGAVTAVAPGTATITAVTDQMKGDCIVRCRWEEQAETAKPDGSGSAPSAKVDLAAFYTSVTGTYEFSNFLELADKEMTDAFYPGLTDIATEQCLVYAMMSMNNGEFALIQVSDSKDVDAVKSILQKRIDDMANGGAWYPEPTRIWTECSKVVSNGNYIMMVVNEDYQAITKDFNALF